VAGGMVGEIFQIGNGELALRAEQSMHACRTTCCKESIAPPLIIIFILEAWNAAPQLQS